MFVKSTKLRGTLYMTLVQDLNMKEIRKIMKRVVGRMKQIWIYKTLEMMKIGQLDDLDFGLSEAMKALDVGGRHLGS